MKEFIFTGNIENELNKFKKFIGNPKEIERLEILCQTGEEVTLAQIAEAVLTISKTVQENTYVNFDNVIDDTLNNDEMIVKVRI